MHRLLETRSDIDRTKLAYLGSSWGAKNGAIIPAVEDRLGASVLVVGGLWEEELPEVDPINYVRRVNVPTLMLNGKYDKSIPYDFRVKPMYNLLGKDRDLKPGDTKDITVYDTDHFVPRDEFVKEANKWLDRHLGQVK